MSQIRVVAVAKGEYWSYHLKGMSQIRVVVVAKGEYIRLTT